MRLTILGVSGSIGKQTIDIIETNKEHFEIVGVSVGENIEELDSQANDDIDEEIINKSLYSFKVRNTKSKVIQLSWASPKLGNNYDMEYGLSDEEISGLKSRLGKKTLTQADYFSKVSPVINRRPLLLVYNIELKSV